MGWTLPPHHSSAAHTAQAPGTLPVLRPKVTSVGDSVVVLLEQYMDLKCQRSRTLPTGPVTSDQEAGLLEVLGPEVVSSSQGQHGTGETASL